MKNLDKLIIAIANKESEILKEVEIIIVSPTFKKIIDIEFSKTFSMPIIIKCTKIEGIRIIVSEDLEEEEILVY